MAALEEIGEILQETFRWLHRHPELSYEEVETTKRLRQVLQAHDVAILDSGLPTGLVAEVGTDGPVIALRADIDALPVTEETGLPYASEIPGHMHACGHDFHTSALLGAALLLKRKEHELQGRVKLVFQPAEEAPGGAKKVLETGLLQDVCAIFGMHVSPRLPVGTLGLRAGAVTASVDRFQITFRGQGTHAAHPDAGIDPIPAAAAFIQAAQTIVSRNLNPFAAGLVSITHVEGGNTWNVIPSTVLVEGTTRSLGKEERQLIRENLCRLAERIAEGHGAQAEIDWYEGPPATDNAPEWIEVARQAAKEQSLEVVEAPASLAGEDFAYYQEQLPGAFVLVGTGHSFSNHHPKFQLDPAALQPAAAFLARLAEEALRRKS
ncbi:amidohydrolase [uncultured Selenomonas sp.]|uniref:amidohydrolase n=1 Tax=uncultured Selenomonas sp. TaxID=159275 RepID=UPI0025CD4E31|nr:amidohydrolase [uncultured Selenomonas sp.]